MSNGKIIKNLFLRGVSLMLLISPFGAYAGNDNYSGFTVAIAPLLLGNVNRTIEGNGDSERQIASTESTPFSIKAGYKFKYWRLYASHSTNISSGVVTDVNYTLINADYVSNGGFVVGLGVGTGNYSASDSTGSQSGTATSFQIGYGVFEQQNAFQWAVLLVGRTLSSDVDNINAKLEFGLTGLDFELGYGF